MIQKILVSDIVNFFEARVPTALQESYDNAGLQTGNPGDPVTGVLICLDVTEEVVDEALLRGDNLIVSHHPLIFNGLKKITGFSPVERILLKAIRNNLSILSVHTNLDNYRGGVNAKIAEKIGLTDCRILQPLKGRLRKLVTFIPSAYVDVVREAIFKAGAGVIGNYDCCSYNVDGYGTFRGMDGSQPFVGEPGKLHKEQEIRFETVFPSWLEGQITKALLSTHPYEEVAFDIYPLENMHPQAGAGMTGVLPDPVSEVAFLERIKNSFAVPVIRHSPLLGKPVRKVALCGGAGTFLLKDALAAGAHIFLTGDVRYHQFFDTSGKIVLADIGHYESEQFTKELFLELLTGNFHTFAVHLSEVVTNPVNYF